MLGDDAYVEPRKRQAGLHQHHDAPAECAACRKHRQVCSVPCTDNQIRARQCSAVGVHTGRQRSEGVEGGLRRQLVHLKLVLTPQCLDQTERLIGVPRFAVVEPPDDDRTPGFRLCVYPGRRRSIVCVSRSGGLGQIEMALTVCGTQPGWKCRAVIGVAGVGGQHVKTSNCWLSRCWGFLPTAVTSRCRSRDVWWAIY